MSHNKRRGGLCVTLSDGTAKKLLLDSNAICELEDVFGIAALYYLNKDENVGFKTVRTILTVGMRAAGSAFEERDVGKLMDSTKFEYYVGVVRDALAWAIKGKSYADVQAEIKTVKAGDEDPLPRTDETEDKPAPTPVPSSGTGCA